MKNMGIEMIKVTAYVIEDKAEGIFTVSLAEKGGPVVSASTYNEARNKFTDALNLSCALRNLIIFRDAVNADDDEKAELAKDLKTHNPEVEFVSIPMPA